MILIFLDVWTGLDCDICIKEVALHHLTLRLSLIIFKINNNYK